MQKFKEGLVFGAGFAISFLLLGYMAAFLGDASTYELQNR
jgi:cytochrome c biogenesis protein CcdA